MIDEPKMTITRGLAELKLLDKRITKAITSGTMMSVSRGDKQVNGDGETFKDATEAYQSRWDSIHSLINRRDQIKRAIIRSNATCQVKIGTRAMTVAEAIERKSSIEYKKTLLDRMKTQNMNVEQFLTSNNATIEQNLQKILEQTLSSEGKESTDMRSFMETYRAVNEFKLFDPLDVRTKIIKLEEEIDTFEAEVDHVLSESNAVTFITL